MKEHSEKSHHSKAGDLVSIEEDDITVESSPPIDTDLPEPGDPSSGAPDPATEAKKAEALKAWRQRHSDDGET